MPVSAEVKLDRYKQRMDELRRKAQEQERVIRERERKRRSTQLIAYGLLVMEKIKNGEFSEATIKAELDSILTQKSHRVAVGLPAKTGANKRPTQRREATGEMVKNTIAKSPSSTRQQVRYAPRSKSERAAHSV